MTGHDVSVVVTQVPQSADPLAVYLETWPPMRHVARGAERLSEAAKARVAARVEEAARATPLLVGDRAALRRFFSFLAQVEVIAIEVPLAALPGADSHTRPLLERQLEDEVFHSLVFAQMAKHLGGLDSPVAEAERLLDRIRMEDDPKTTAILLNAIAEGWIENLFEHAAAWGVADDLFQMVLADEARHVEEAHQHADGVDAGRVATAVRAFEAELFRLAQHPRVVLPLLGVAGEANFRRLSESFLHVHVSALKGVGLEPEPAIVEMQGLVDGQGKPWLQDDKRPVRIEPESQWRRTAMQLWDVPRNPVMHGWFDVRVDHFPRRLLTALMVAAVGRVWAEFPRMNRYAWGGSVWQPAGVNVGVRVTLDGRGDLPEALSTIVVPDADKRSVNDIVRIIQAGLTKMNEFAEDVEDLPHDPEAEALSTILMDDELMRLVPAESVTCPVTISNVGRAGLTAGFGSMPGALGQSVELIIGRVQKRPVWTGWRYAPRDVVTIGAGADHRVIDGNHCAEAMARIEAALSKQGVKEILARPDTLSPEADVGDQMLGALGISPQQAQVFASCKLPFWLGWLCWIFKK